MHPPYSVRMPHMAAGGGQQHGALTREFSPVSTSAPLPILHGATTFALLTLLSPPFLVLGATCHSNSDARHIRWLLQ